MTICWVGAKMCHLDRCVDGWDTEMTKLNNISFSCMFSECTAWDIMNQGMYQY